MRTKTPYVRVKLDQWALVSFLCGFFLYRQKNWNLKPINENTENFFKILRGMFFARKGYRGVREGEWAKMSRETTLYYFEPNGYIPNNPTLPVLHYKQVLKNSENNMGKIFQSHNWGNSWVDGVFPYHHYHSNSHEVLGIMKGSALLQIGGDQGSKIILHAGDVLLLPAGTGHKKLSGTPDLQVIGAYPNGQHYNTRRDTEEDFRVAVAEIENAPFPQEDPVFGKRGPLIEIWTRIKE